MQRKKPAATTSARLVFDHVALSKKGPTLAMNVPVGGTVAIVGPAASGKSSLTRVILGEVKPERGTIVREEAMTTARIDEWGRRDRPQAMAKEASDRISNEAIADLLTSLGLWEFRQQACAKLSQSQQAAARLIEPLASDAATIVLDGDLDILDPWCIEGLWSYLRQRTGEGKSLIFATQRPDLAERADFVIVLKNQQLVFAGSPDSLVRTAAPSEITVSAEDQPGVLALTEAFAVTIEETSEGTIYSTTEGQQLAARLLLEGYGNVRYLIKRTPSFRESLLKLTTSA